MQNIKAVRQSQPKVPQLFVDDDSGEGCQLFGYAGNLEMAVQNAMAYVRVAIDQLLDGESEVSLTFRREDMTDEEVASLPEV